MNSENFLNLLYTKKLPKIYRDLDETENFALKRYLSSLIEGGFIPCSNDAEKVLDLIDPLKCPEEFFPYLCTSFGIPFYKDIDISYQRRFLNNYNNLIKRRGTFSIAKYLVRALTGLKAELEYLEEYKGETGHFLKITLFTTSIKNAVDMSKANDVIQRYIKEFLPYFIDVKIEMTVVGEISIFEYYTTGIVGTVHNYSLLNYTLDN